MKPILIIQNSTPEDPGLIEVILRERKIPYEIVDLDSTKGESFPAPQNYSAVIVLGGPDSANDDTPKMKQELDRVREVIALDVPFLGICLGLQVLVKAAGGSVIKSPLKEVAFRDPDNHFFSIVLTEEGAKDPLLKGFSKESMLFQLHSETVTLNPSTSLLASGKFCKNQIVKIARRAYGIQGHFEVTPEKFSIWIEEDPDLLKLNRDELLQDYAYLQKQLEQNGRRLFNNFLSLAGF